MDYFIGFDVGSSKTHALLVDENGECLSLGTAGGGNQQMVGYDGLERVLRESLDQACRNAGISSGQIKGAGFGISGYDFEADRPAHEETISRLNLTCPFDLMNDGWNGLLVGANHGIGVNVTAGSGVNCRGRSPNGREGRIVGNGSAFGEFGGGAEIALLGLHKLNHAWMKRIPPTSLTGIYLQAAGASDELDLMQGLSTYRYRIDASIAIQVFAAARAGDAAALEVLHFSGAELGWLAVAVIRQIGMEGDEVEVIQSGSVFDGGELISAPMREVLQAHAPKARLKRLDGLPVIGPVILGFLAAGRDGYAVRTKMIDTSAENRKRLS